MKTINRKGSALVLVIIASMFLIILTAGAYRYFQTNVDTQIWTRDRIQAKLTAEAGVNLATHMLIAGAALPTDSTPQPFLGTEATFFVLPGDLGSVYASVDPSNENDMVVTANAFMINCIANVPGESYETYGMRSIVMPENLARFAIFMDNPSTDGSYVDGYRFDGPFYANGPVRVQSSSATHEDDPFFYSFKLTSDYYLASGTTHQTTPTDGGNLEMRPYQRLCLGPPYFELGADPIPFGASELDWEGVRSAADSDGLSLTDAEVPSNSRLLLQNDTLFIKTTFDDLVIDTFPLADLDNPVVWIENESFHRIYIRGAQPGLDQGLNMALTIGTQGDVYMSGDLYYGNTDPQDPDNTDILGIMSVGGDMIIADQLTDTDDWGDVGFKIITEDSFIYSAVLVALEGDLMAENHKWPHSPGPEEFQIIGGYMIQEEGITSGYEAGGSGFDISVYFDPRLLYMHPPFFPTTANWNTTMWEDVSDMLVSDVTNGVPSGY